MLSLTLKDLSYLGQDLPNVNGVIPIFLVVREVLVILLVALVLFFAFCGVWRIAAAVG